MNPSCPEFDPCASNNNSIDNEISRQSEIAMDQQTKHRFDKSLAALYRAASLSKHSYGSSDSRTLKLNEEIASVWFRKGNYSQAEETLNYVLQQRLHCYSSYNVDTLNTSKFPL